MEHTDLDTILKALQDTPVRVPLHQAKLRERLISQHASQAYTQRYFLGSIAWSLRARALLAKRRLSIGVVFAAVVMALLGLLLLLPNSESSPAGQKFIAQPIEAHPAAHPTPASDTTSCSQLTCPDPGPKTATPPAPVLSSVSTQLSDSDSSAPETQIAATVPVAAAPDAQTPPSKTTVVIAIDSTESDVPISVTVDVGATTLLDTKDKVKKDKTSKADKPAKDKAAKTK